MESLRPGALIGGKYRLGEALWEHDRRVVFRAENVDIAREVELKTLSLGVEPRDDAFLGLMREAMAAGSVAHANVQSVLDSGLDDRGLPYIVFESLAGVPLDEWMAGEGVSRTEDDIAELLIPFLEGLSAVHEGGVVHRALSAKTVVLVPIHGRKLLKLTNFSHAVMIFADDSALRGSRDSELPRDVPLPPQHSRGAGPDPSWDVFAAGSLLKTLSTDLASGTFIGSPLLDRVIRGATAPNVEERYPNARVMLEAATVLSHPLAGMSTLPAPELLDPEEERTLGGDLRFMKLRRDTNHGAGQVGEGQGRVHLLLVLLIIEWLFQRLGQERWETLVAQIPEAEGWLPGSGNTDANRRLGISVGRLSGLLALVDQLEGAGDLGFVAAIGQDIAPRATERLLPDAIGAMSPGQVPVLFPRLWRAMMRQGHGRSLERGDGFAVLSVEQQVEPTLEFAALVAGFLQGLLRQAAQSPASDGGRVEITACEALGDPATVYRLSW